MALARFYDRKIDIYVKTYVSDGYGGQIASDVFVKSIYAKIITNAGNKFVNFGIQDFKNPTIFSVRGKKNGIEQQWNKNGSPKCDISERAQSWQIIVNYAKFLKQPLKLEMFVPCINDEPISSVPYYADGVEKINEYKAAKEKVLFEDAISMDTTPYKSTKRVLIDLKERLRIYSEFRFHDGSCEIVNYLNKGNLTIESLVNLNLTITPSALQKIGIKE